MVCFQRSESKCGSKLAVEQKSIMGKQRFQIADILVAKRLQMSRESRQVDGLIAMLRRIASDLEGGRAVESDFEIQVEEGNNLDAIDITLTTYHLKPISKKLSEKGNQSEYS